MQLKSVNAYYRKASAGTPTEDGIAMNLHMGNFLVCDGVSGPYSPSNPGIKYFDGLMTGGQMVTQMVSSQPWFPGNIKNLLRQANHVVRLNHVEMGKDPKTEAVAGACVAACQLQKDMVELVIIGDCFAFVQNKHEWEFFTNFDQAAFDFEEKGNEIFAECLERVGGHKGKAWDEYYSYFAQKQFFRANKNLGQGGHAMLNGDSAAEQCWTRVILSQEHAVEKILLGTDGLLPCAATNPKERDLLISTLGNIYHHGGIPAILEWRDKTDYLPHIGKNQWPEASAIELKF